MRHPFFILNPNGIKMFIRGGDLKPCISCKYFLPDNITHPTSNPSLAKCMKFGVKNIVSNVITYDFAEKCRDDPTKCDESAIFYEKSTSYVNRHTS